MQPLRATVRSGRLLLDEPTSLPDSEVVDLVPLDDVLAAGGDDLDDEERTRLHAALDRARSDVAAGRTVGADEVLARIGGGSKR